MFSCLNVLMVLQLRKLLELHLLRRALPLHDAVIQCVEPLMFATILILTAEAPGALHC
jgi:hypothetical protein